uniref:Uncharacterized protein n=1 Tax=viral metagenome TaxID=1070528 RepID=A0A6M3J7Y3_9ZZZZ
MTEKLREEIEKIVAHQFDSVTNLRQEAYLDSLKMIADQILPLIEAQVKVRFVEAKLEVLGDEEINQAYEVAYEKEVHTPSMDTSYPSLTEEICAKDTNGKRAISQATIDKQGKLSRIMEE